MVVHNNRPNDAPKRGIFRREIIDEAQLPLWDGPNSRCTEQSRQGKQAGPLQGVIHFVSRKPAIVLSKMVQSLLYPIDPALIC